MRIILNHRQQHIPIATALRVALTLALGAMGAKVVLRVAEDNGDNNLVQVTVPIRVNCIH